MKINKLIFDSGIYIFLSFFQKGISFLLIPFYTYFLSPQEFGLVNQIIALHSIFILITTFSLNESLAKGIGETENKIIRDQIKFNIVFINIILVFLITILLLLFNAFFYDVLIPDAGRLKFYSIIIVSSTPIFFIYQKYLRMLGELELFSKIMLGYIILQVLLSVLFIYLLELGVEGYMLSIMFSSLVFAIISYIKLFSFKRSLLSWLIIKSKLKYALSLLPHTLSGWGMNGYTNLVLGSLSSVYLVGILNAVNILGVVINVISKSVLDAFQPWIYNMLKSNQNESKLIASVINIICAIIVLLGVILIIFDDLILKLLIINTSYHEGIKYAPLLILNSVLLSMGSMTVYVIYFYDNKVKFVSISTITGVIINVIIGYILIQYYQLLGAIISLIIANFIVSIIKLNISSKILKAPYNLFEHFFIIFFVTYINYYFENYSLFINLSAFIYLILKIIFLIYRIRNER